MFVKVFRETIKTQNILRSSYSIRFFEGIFICTAKKYLNFKTENEFFKI